MARLEEFDYQTVKHIQQEINDVLKQIGESHGINLEIGHLKWDKMGFKGSIEAQTTDPENESKHGGDGIDYRKKWKDEFVRNCHLFGLDQKHLGQNIQISNHHYRIIGLQTRARKYKFICVNLKGRCYRFSTTTIKTALNLI